MLDFGKVVFERGVLSALERVVRVNERDMQYLFVARERDALVRAEILELGLAERVVDDWRWLLTIFRQFRKRFVHVALNERVLQVEQIEDDRVEIDSVS